MFNNDSGQFNGDVVFFYNPASGTFELDAAIAVGPYVGWANGGTNVLAPGVACWFQNVGPSNVTITFSGTIPSAPLTNELVPGFNLVGSMLPTSGDLCSNSVTALTNYNLGDQVFVYSPISTNFAVFESGVFRNQGYGYSTVPGGEGDWSAAGDPTVPDVGEGFWYFNSGATAINWIEP